MSWSFKPSDLTGINTLAKLKDLLVRELPKLWERARFYEQVADLKWGSLVTPSGDTRQAQNIKVTDVTDFTIANPTNPREGAELTLDIWNQSNAPLGTVTFGSEYVLATAFDQPDIDGHGVYTFVRSNDAKWRELFRSVDLTPVQFASFTSSASGRVVTFTDTSTGPVSWSWTFGDGGTSAVQNPSHTYAADGTYTVTLVATNGAGATSTASHSVAVAATGTAGGTPFGCISNHWATNTTLKNGLAWMTLSEQSNTPSQINARIDAFTALGLKGCLRFTGGAHTSADIGATDMLSLFNGVATFDRIKFDQKNETFNTTSIKNKIAANLAPSGPVVGCDLMDEPFVTGGGDGNTWGPSGTMVKNGPSLASPVNHRWGIVLSSNKAITAGTTSISVNAISSPWGVIPSGTTITFIPGTGKKLVLAADANAGDTSLSVTGVPVALTSGDTSYSNSLDNMAQSVKNIHTGLNVGVTHSNQLFRSDQSYTIMDFIIAQYVNRYGDPAVWRDNNLSKGATDHHRIVFSINPLNGGDRISGCPTSGTPPQTEGPGTTNLNCRMNYTQFENSSTTLMATNGASQRGVGLLIWRYDGDWFDPLIGVFAAQNQVALQNVANTLAAKSFINWSRF